MVTSEVRAASAVRPVSLRNGIVLVLAVLGLGGSAVIAYQLVGSYTCASSESAQCAGDTLLLDSAPITLGLFALLVVVGLIGGGRLAGLILPAASITAGGLAVAIWLWLPIGEQHPWLVGLAAGLLLIGIVLIGGRLAAGARARQRTADGVALMRIGTPVAGRISSVQVTDTEIRGAPLVLITVEYAGQDGALRTYVKERAVDVDHLPRTGDRTVVWYDPDAPERVEFAHSSEQGPLDQLVERVLGPGSNAPLPEARGPHGSA
ncbi:DUF3592 domain-containing protein [Actinoalloteichus hymeniacidonis]|nr:DUF3592 domain-containing protein [Actinoalloteichus hymeniacidonis]MBB5906861.1 hypothetical protein [Actinoalloteichus hymeniacidonis]